MHYVFKLFIHCTHFHLQPDIVSTLISSFHVTVQNQYAADKISCTRSFLDSFQLHYSCLWSRLMIISPLIELNHFYRTHVWNISLFSAWAGGREVQADCRRGPDEGGRLYGARHLCPLSTHSLLPRMGRQVPLVADVVHAELALRHVFN